MATTIRLKKVGRKNQPFFRVVVLDSRKKRDGATIEEIGWYNPLKQGNNYLLKNDRVVYWLEKGAQPSDTVRSLLKEAGILFQWHLKSQGMDDKLIDLELQKWMLDREVKRNKEKETSLAEGERKRNVSESAIAVTSDTVDSVEEK